MAFLEVKCDLGKGDFNKFIDYGWACIIVYIVFFLIGLFVFILFFKLWRFLFLELLWYIVYVLIMAIFGYIFY